MVVRVAPDVPRELGLPEIPPGFGVGRASAAFVTVPEAAMDEDDHSPRGEYDVRATREIAPVQPEPVAQTMKQAPHGQFRLRVLASDAAHEQAARWVRSLIARGRHCVP